MRNPANGLSREAVATGPREIPIDGKSAELPP
jgi:hypothetical protein